MSTERWASRLGLVMAMAGSAIGLGNFLRFPRLAAEHGGGAFMVPYLTALVVLGVPLMWLEWSMGRFGGRHGHSTTVGMFGRLWKSRWARIIGSLGVSLPLLFVAFYTYIESWTLAYAWYSATGTHVISEAASAVQPLIDSGNPLASEPSYRFLREYQGAAPTADRAYFHTLFPAVTFWLFAVGLNTWIISRGVSGGIERLARIAMPLLFLFAIALAIRVLTMGAPDPAYPDRSVWVGLNYIWEPNFSALRNFNVWLAAAGQIFFTLSIGTGTIQCYASYLRPDDDCALTGLTTAATNEFAEVILGATIAIPMSVAAFGLASTQAIASQGSFDLGFVAMPIVFQQMPLGELFATMWFTLLFFAGVTSSVGLCQPLVALLQEEYGISRRGAAAVCAAAMIALGAPILLYLPNGYMDQFDFWVGTVGLVVFALAEVLVFGWAYGKTGLWQELTHGAQLRVPRATLFLLRWVAPICLSVLLIGWMWQSLDEEVLLIGVSQQDVMARWGARSVLVCVVLTIAILTWISPAHRKRSTQESQH